METTIVPIPGIDAVLPALKVTTTPLIVVLKVLTTKVFPSTSESSVPSVNTLPETAVFSFVDFTSSTATGGSLTGVIEILKSPISEPPLVSVAV